MGDFQEHGPHAGFRQPAEQALPPLTGIAQTESLFREQNQKLASLYSADSSGEDEPLPFLCECANPRCTKIITLTLPEYRSVRRHPMRFLVLPGHELGDELERVIDQGPGYLIIEKHGQLAHLLDALDQLPQSD